MPNSLLKPPARKAPAPSPAPRTIPRRKSADQRLRVMERVIAGLSVAHIARAETLTVRRVRQIIAESVDRREIDPPVAHAQLQIARLSEAMIVAHTMMSEGNLEAVDRVIKITAEIDRYHRALPAPPQGEQRPEEAGFGAGNEKTVSRNA